MFVLIWIQSGSFSKKKKMFERNVKNPRDSNLVNRKFYECSTNGFFVCLLQRKIFIQCLPKIGFWSFQLILKNVRESKMDEIEKSNNVYVQKKAPIVRKTKAKHDFQSNSGHFHCSISNVFV